MGGTIISKENRAVKPIMAAARFFTERIVFWETTAFELKITRRFFCSNKVFKRFPYVVLPYISAIVRISAQSSSDISSAFIRHFRFSPTVEGVFIRFLSSSPSQSCIGITHRLARLRIISAINSLQSLSSGVYSSQRYSRAVLQDYLNEM